MRNIIETFSFIKSGINFSVAVVCANTNDGFSDDWELTDNHQGGVTVKNPLVDSNSYKYAIPKNFTLAERAEMYRKEGRANPCADAYQAAKESLRRDLTASDYYFTVSADIDGVSLFSDVTVCCGFTYSYEDANTLAEEALSVWTEHAGEQDAIDEARKAVTELTAAIVKLESITF